MTYNVIGGRAIDTRLVGGQLQIWGSAARWRPNLIDTPSMVMWLRPDELAAGALASWPDSSGNADHMSQATAAQRPTVVAGGLNGYPVAQFDGVDDRMLGTLAHSLKPHTVFAMVNPTNYTTSRSILGGESDGGGAPGDYYLVIDGTFGVTLTKRGLITIGDSTTVPTAGAWSILSETYDAAGAFAFFLNGASDGSGTNDQTLVSSRLSLGCNGFVNPNLTLFLGSMAEVIVCAAVLSAADREKVEGYLAWKYNRQSALPGAHSYKSAAP